MFYNCKRKHYLMPAEKNEKIKGKYNDTSDVALKIYNY